jgi:hypothetical protein
MAGLYGAPGYADVFPPPELLRIVGHDEDALSEMGGSEIRSSYTRPFRIVPESGQISENCSKSERKVAWDVFQQRVAGSKYAK